VSKALLPKLEGCTEKQKKPHPPDRLAWAAWIIARLDDWFGYAAALRPGPKVFSRELRRFYSIAEGFYLHQICQ
jgi:hypothetical protein